MENLPTLQDVDRALAEQYLDHFIRQAWHVIEPVTPYRHNWHIDYIAEFLQLVGEGKILRLGINIPPRWMKSIEVSVMWPAWLWIKFPHLRFLFGSYSQLLSTKHSVDRRNILLSQWYAALWGHNVQLMPDQNQKAEFMNTKYGHMIATSVGGSVTGKGGDIIVIDDPLDPNRAMSKPERESANRWIDQTLSTRLNNKETGAIVLVMQRLHVDDAIGHLKKLVDEATGEKDWTIISLPAEVKKDTEYTFPISGRKVVHKAGESLWPERESTTVLKSQKRQMGEWAYTGQYLQRPSPLSGGIFKRDKFKTYDRAPNLEYVNTIISVDATFKKTTDGSFVCMQVWSAWGASRFLHEEVRERMGFVETLNALWDLRERWPMAMAVLIEDKANGPAIVDVLQKKIPGMLPIGVMGSKEERAASVSPQVEAGNVYIPSKLAMEGGIWVDEWLEEVCSFPATALTDRVDSMSQALWYLLPFGMEKGEAEAVFNSPSVAQAMNWDT